MARIRTIKPEFWADEKIAPLPPIDRLVFLGLISQADDAGRLVDNVKTLDGLLFPETDDSSGPSLERLSDLGRVVRYKASSGQSLVQIVKWEEHQKVVHPSKYTLPPPPNPNGSEDSKDSLLRISRDTQDSTNDQRPTTNEHRTPLRDAEFEEFWLKYPKRAGANPKPAASQAWNARVSEGVDPSDILAGLDRYVLFLETTEQVGSQFVQQAATFLGKKKRSWEEPWDLPPDKRGGAGESFRGFS